SASNASQCSVFRTAQRHERLVTRLPANKSPKMITAELKFDCFCRTPSEARSRLRRGRQCFYSPGLVAAVTKCCSFVAEIKIQDKICRVVAAVFCGFAFAAVPYNLVPHFPPVFAATNFRRNLAMPETLRPTSAPDAGQAGHEGASFAETAMKLGGKSEEEARRMGAVDKAADQVESLFAARFQTVNSPIHRAVWERKLPVELFTSQPAVTPPEVDRVMQQSLDVVRGHVTARTLLDENKKITNRVFTDLAAAGYW